MAHLRMLQGELDELEREEFFRLKKVQKKKKKDEELRMEQAAAQVPVRSYRCSVGTGCASICLTVLVCVALYHERLSGRHVVVAGGCRDAATSICACERGHGGQRHHILAPQASTHVKRLCRAVPASLRGPRTVLQTYNTRWMSSAARPVWHARQASEYLVQCTTMNDQGTSCHDVICNAAAVQCPLCSLHMLQLPPQLCCIKHGCRALAPWLACHASRQDIERVRSDESLGLCIFKIK